MYVPSGRGRSAYLQTTTEQSSAHDVVSQAACHVCCCCEASVWSVCVSLSTRNLPEWPFGTPSHRSRVTARDNVSSRGLDRAAPIEC